MATPERNTTYTTTDTTRTVPTRESSSTGWFVGVIVALALLAIGYLVFSANNNTVNTGTPAATTTAPADGVAVPNTTEPVTTPVAPAPAVQ